MKIVAFEKNGQIGAGRLADDGQSVLPFALPAEQAAQGAQALIEAAVRGDALPATAAPVALGQVRLLAPLPRPRRNIFCVGKNYYEHAHEFQDSGFDASSGGEAVPTLPILFTKATTIVIGPEAPIPASSDPTASVDYEGELTVVIGRGGRHIAKAQAYDHVYGYTIINDVTSRTQQHAHKQWFLGKSLDGFCPMGPWLVTADEVGDVTALRMVTRVNDEVRQDVKVSQLIFDIPTLIETLSANITLEPGDLIATGTPSGVGIGFKPPRYLKPGDSVSITIDRLGTLLNPVN